MPDVHSSSVEYAQRFSGKLGAWILKRQGESVVDLLSSFKNQTLSILDVGGGHAQLTPYLVEAGHKVTVLGSTESCSQQLTDWIKEESITFTVGKLTQIPFPDSSFDVVVSVRQVCHFPNWKELLSEMCRVAKQAVIFDYPTIKSVNLFSTSLFSLKKKVEGNTRPFLVFTDSEIRRHLHNCGYHHHFYEKQFVLPLALYRAINNVTIAKSVECFSERVRLTNVLGSPVILLAMKSKPNTSLSVKTTKPTP